MSRNFRKDTRNTTRIRSLYAVPYRMRAGPPSRRAASSA